MANPLSNEPGRRPARLHRNIPLNPDELGALPPTLIQIGTADSAFLDAVRFARAARAAGCQTTLDVWDGLSHAWQHHRDRPEAEAALLEAARFAVTLGH